MLQQHLHLKSLVVTLALLALGGAGTGCAWKGAPPVIKVANAVGWTAMPAGTAIAVFAPDACVTDPDVPGAMECGRSKGYLTLGVLLAVAGLVTVVFTHTGLK